MNQSGTPATPKDLIDGSQLAHILNGPDGGCIVRGFQEQISECLDALLVEGLSTEQVLWYRAKAMGLLETLGRFGYQIGLAQSAAVLDASRRSASQALGRSAQGRG